MSTFEEAIAAAWADYRAAVGTVIETHTISTIINYDAVELTFDPPIRVLVLPTAANAIMNHGEDWVDPYWDVMPIEEALKPEFRRDHGQLDSTRGYWINGPEHRYCSKKNAP